MLLGTAGQKGVFRSLRQQAERHRVWVALGAGIISLSLLWWLRDYVEFSLSALINILTLGLATYISLRIESSLKVKAVAWLLVVLIALATLRLNFREQQRETLYFDILSPQMTALDAFAEAKLEIPDDGRYQLLDVIGSYYICLKKPDTFFHRFPEWVFVFRGPAPNRITEIRVTDGRLPELPKLGSGESQAISDGDLLMHMRFKVPLAYLGVEGVPAEDKDVVVDIDPESRALMETVGHGPDDDFAEVVESENTKVFARVRSVGRRTDRPEQYHVHESVSSLGKVIIATAEYEQNSFYQSLEPITEWRIDIEQAIGRALAAGAKATPPGKFGMGGGPGCFRLFNGKHDNLKGAYWQLPFRIGIRPILVDAKKGKVLAVNDAGDYSDRW